MSLSTTNLFSGSSPVIQFDCEFKPTAYQIDYYNEFFKNNINLSHRSWVKEQKKESTHPMAETQTVTKSFRMRSHSHTEGESEVSLTGTQYHSDKLIFRSLPGELQELFESSKVGDEFLFIVIKQPKAEK